MQTTHYFKSD